MAEIEKEELWRKETVSRVFEIVSMSKNLQQRDLISLLLVSPWFYRTLTSNPSLWQVLDLRETSNAGERLIAALSLFRYRHIKRINMVFAQDIEDNHLNLLKTKCVEALQSLEVLNLNGCQKISDNGIEAVTSVCPNLKTFSIYWNMRVTDLGIMQLARNCKHIVHLNLSGCKNITDESLYIIADSYQNMETLNLTRCIKLTDNGLEQIMLKCSYLQSLNLYALSRCVRVTDVGVMVISHGCTSLEFLSLFGIVGVSDEALQSLSRSCSSTLTTLDVNGCIRIKGRSRDELLRLFPRLVCFKVHS